LFRLTDQRWEDGSAAATWRRISRLCTSVGRGRARPAGPKQRQGRSGPRAAVAKTRTQSSDLFPARRIPDLFRRKMMRLPFAPVIHLSLDRAHASSLGNAHALYIERIENRQQLRSSYLDARPGGSSKPGSRFGNRGRNIAARFTESRGDKISWIPLESRRRNGSDPFRIAFPQPTPQCETSHDAGAVLVAK